MVQYTNIDDEKNFKNEIEDYSDNEKDEVKSESFRYNIDSYTNAIPVERIVEDFNSNIIRLPDFQRPYVWDKRDTKTARHRPSLFIDSILQGLPIPSVTIYKNTEDREQGLLIDGRQRITTLSWYINQKLDGKDKKFALHGEGVSKDWEDKTFRQLDPAYQDILNRAYISVTYIRQLNKDTPQLPNASSLYVLFDRFNSGGYTLHPHEKRGVLVIYNPNRENMNTLLDFVYNMDEWKEFFPFTKDTNITLYREYIFRIVAFLLSRKDYGGVIARFLDSFMLTYSITNQEIEKFNAHLQNVLRLVSSIKGGSIKKLFSPESKFNVAFYEAFIVAVLKIYFDGYTISKGKILEAYKIICEEKLYYDESAKNSKPGKIYVQKRYDRIYRILKEKQDV